MERRAFLLSLLATSVAWSRDAASKCRQPEAFFAMPVDGRVPANPIIHLFTRARAPKAPLPEVIATDERGRALRTTVQAVSRAPSFEAFAVKVAVKAPHEMSMKLRGDDRATEGRLSVVAKYRPPNTKPVTIVNTETEDFAWTCSRQHSRNLTPSVVAPAYRLTWAKTAASERAPPRSLLPASMTSFFTGKTDAPPILELGQSNCIGRSFDFGGLALWIRLQALFPDGSFTPPTKHPRRVSPPG